MSSPILFHIGRINGNNSVCVFFSALLKMNEELTKERDQLLTTVESLREKLNKSNATQQEVEAQKESALENISQVNSH